tara:strand:- start:113 stop:370 length:258 start_codon:yes stop_codon:yes gene_type:complete
MPRNTQRVDNMIERLLFMTGCPICKNSGPSIVTMSFQDPMPCEYGHLDGLTPEQREKFIEIHQSHRMASIMTCEHILGEDVIKCD